MTRRKRVVIWLGAAATTLALAAIVLVPLGVQMWKTHELTWDWVLTAKTVPTRVQYANRNFICQPNATPHPLSLDGLTVRGKTAGGGDIYADEPSPGASVVVGIAIKTDGGFVSCSLSGGP